MVQISEETLLRLRMLSCENVAQKLGMDVVRHKSLCFMHDDHHPSLAFRGQNQERWWCFVCNKGGDAIQLVMEAANLGFMEACQWLGVNFGISVTDSESVSHKWKQPLILKRKKGVQHCSLFSIEVALWILKHCKLTVKASKFLFEERKLDVNVVNKMGIVSLDNSQPLINQLQKEFSEDILINSGLVTKTNNRLYLRLFTPCLIFPYYNTNMQLVGIQSRYLGTTKGAPRFQFVSHQRSRLFNLPILNEMKPYEDLYITEGVTDCLALLSSGKKAIAVPSATILPQVDLIKLAAFNLHMYPDNDNAGRKVFFNLKGSLIRYGAVLHKEMLPLEFKDYCDYYRIKYGKHE